MGRAAFFRVVPRFVVQFGIAADPAVDRAWDRKAMADDPVAASNVRGAVSFATSGPGTRTTQVLLSLSYHSLNMVCCVVY